MAQDDVPLETIEEVHYWEWWNPIPSWVHLRTATGDVILCRDPQRFRQYYDVAAGVEVRFGVVPLMPHKEGASDGRSNPQDDSRGDI